MYKRLITSILWLILAVVLTFMATYNAIVWQDWIVVVMLGFTGALSIWLAWLDFSEWRAKK